MAAGSIPVKDFFFSSTFQTHFVQLIKPSQVFVRPTGIQALSSIMILDKHRYDMMPQVYENEVEINKRY